MEVQDNPMRLHPESQKFSGLVSGATLDATIDSVIEVGQVIPIVEKLATVLRGLKQKGKELITTVQNAALVAGWAERTLKKLMRLPIPIKDISGIAEEKKKCMRVAIEAVERLLKEMSTIRLFARPNGTASNICTLCFRSKAVTQINKESFDNAVKAVQAAVDELKVHLTLGANEVGHHIEDMVPRVLANNARHTGRMFVALDAIFRRIPELAASLSSEAQICLNQAIRLLHMSRERSAAAEENRVARLSLEAATVVEAALDFLPAGTTIAAEFYLIGGIAYEEAGYFVEAAAKYTASIWVSFTLVLREREGSSGDKAEENHTTTSLTAAEEGLRSVFVNLVDAVSSLTGEILGVAASKRVKLEVMDLLASRLHDTQRADLLVELEGILDKVMTQVLREREALEAFETAEERDYGKLREIERQREEKARSAEKQHTNGFALRRARNEAQDELEDALESKDVDRLAAAIETARKLKLRSSSSERALEALRSEASERRKVLAELAQSSKRKNIFRLSNAIDEARTIGLDVFDAERLLAQLEGEQQQIDEKIRSLLKHEREASDSRDYDMAETLQKERRALPQMSPVRRAFERLEDAREKQDIEALEEAITEAKAYNDLERKNEQKVGTAGAEALLQKLKEELARENEAKRELHEAMNANDIRRLQNAIKQGDKCGVDITQAKLLLEKLKENAAAAKKAADEKAAADRKAAEIRRAQEAASAAQKAAVAKAEAAKQAVVAKVEAEKRAAVAKAQAEKRAALEKVEAERKAAEEKAKESLKAFKERVEAERKAAEEKAEAERRAFENLMAAARRAAEEKARSEQQAEAEMRARRAAATLFQADRRAAQARKARRAPDPDRALWEECSYDKADPEKISRLLNCGADPNMKYGVSQIHKNTLHQFH